MSEQDTFYIHKVYPLQDQVLSLFTNLRSRFYLTGGTALSRFMLEHRKAREEGKPCEIRHNKFHFPDFLAKKILRAFSDFV